MKTKKTVTPAVLAANRANSKRSTGPTSAAGKQRSRLNALKDGIFSKDVVVPAAGERVEDFERFKEWLWDGVQPEGAIEEIYTDDSLNSWWGRQRVRRCRAAYLQSRMENLKTGFYLRSDEVAPVKVRFQLALERYQATTASTSSGDLNEIVTEMENARSQLASTPLGLEFLIKRVNTVKQEAESTRRMSPASEVVLRACAGLMNDFVRFAIVVNRCNITLAAKAAEREPAGEGGTGPTKEMNPQKAKGDQSLGKRGAGKSDKAGKRVLQATLVCAIENIARELRGRKQLFEIREKWYGESRFAAAVLPADGTGDRFERAETMYERRLYRALGALQALQESKAASKSLP